MMRAEWLLLPATLAAAGGIAIAAATPPFLPPTIPFAFNGTTTTFKGAYLGCSNTEFVVQDYQLLSSNSPGGVTHPWLWQPTAGTFYSITAPGYDTTSQAVAQWAVADIPPGSVVPWTRFQTQINAFGQPDFVFVGLCENAALAVSTFADVQQMFTTLKAFVTTRNFYITTFMRYVAPTSACVSKLMTTGVPDTDRFVQYAVATGLALPGPVLPLLTVPDRLADDCHPKNGALRITTLASDAAQGATSVTVAAAGSIGVGSSIAFAGCGAVSGSHYTTVTSVAGTTFGIADGMGKLCTANTLATASAQAMKVHDFFDNIGTTP